MKKGYLLALVLLALTANVQSYAASTDKLESERLVADQGQSATAIEQTHRLSPGDTITLKVFGEPDLSLTAGTGGIGSVGIAGTDASFVTIGTATPGTAGGNSGSGGTIKVDAALDAAGSLSLIPQHNL